MKIIELPYTKDLTKEFNNIHYLPFSIWLDSGDAELYNQHYDIISSLPYKTLISDTESTIEYNHEYSKRFFIKSKTVKNYKHTKYNPISLVNSILESLKYKNSKYAKDIPFWHGAMGYFGYDLNQLHCKQLKKNKADSNIPLMAIGFYAWALISDHKKKTTYICYDQSKIDSILITDIIERLSEFNSDSLISSNKELNKTIKVFFEQNKFSTSINIEEYQEKFNTIKNHIKNGDCYQINYTIPFNCNISSRYSFDSWHVYQHLKHLNKNPFGCYFRLNSDQAILSFSPERFIKINNNTITAQPIKGSIARSENFNKDEKLKNSLSKSQKDQAENIMITDLLRNDLNKHCIPGTVKTTDICKVESYPTIHHLVTTIKGKIKPELSPLEVFNGCFPGGSITGTPKISAMKIIQKLENSDNNLHRYLYCGSIGYINIDGNLDTSIVIRTVFHDKQELKYWAGSGIVADSDCHQECSEIIAKVIKTKEHDIL